MFLNPNISVNRFAFYRVMLKIIAFSFIFLCNLGYASEPPSPAPSKSAAKPQENSAGINKHSNISNGSSLTPTSIVVNGPPSIDDVVTQNESKNGDGEPSSEWWLVSFTGCLVILNALLAGSTAKLVRRSDENAKMQLRAHVFPESIEISNIDAFDASGNDRVKIRIKNYGQTPAYKCTCERRYDIFDFPVRIFPELKIPPNDPAPSLIDIPPGGFYETSITYKRPANDVRSDVINGIKAIYVYGVIEYEDAFGVTRTTKFRYMCGGDSGVSAGAMYACHEGNKAT